MSIKKTKFSQSTAWFLGILIILLIAVWSAVFQKTDSNLHLYFLNVGQGDSIYVRLGHNYDLLIDGGPDKSVLSELGEIMPFYDRKINLIILTHPHADHIRGLIEVLKRYQVNEVWLTDAVHNSPEYLEFLKTIKEKQIFTKIVKNGDKKILSPEKNKEQAIIKIFWPMQSYRNQDVDNLNNTSIVLRLIYGDFSALLTGDAETEAQIKILLNHKKEDLKSDILKVPHQGSRDAYYEKFVEAVSPKAVVISVGRNNKFGHPHQEVINSYQQKGIDIFRTDQNGRVEIISDSQKYWIKCQTNTI